MEKNKGIRALRIVCILIMAFCAILLLIQGLGILLLSNNVHWMVIILNLLAIIGLVCSSRRTHRDR